MAKESITERALRFVRRPQPVAVKADPLVPISFPIGAAWYVVYCQPRREDRAKFGLEEKGFSVFLPKTKRWVKHARYKKEVSYPLFPRYLFVSLDIDKQEWFWPVTSTDGVEDLLRNNSIPMRVPSAFIEEIRELEKLGRFDETTAVLNLKPGDAVKVVSGPFAGMIGAFKGSSDKKRVEILLNLLGGSTPAKIAIENLRTE